MKNLKCENCGSSDFKRIEGMYVCSFCKSKYVLTQDEVLVKESEINLSEDVRNLLRKWDNDPGNADRYARLILEIDPSNPRAKSYLASKSSGGCYIATCVYGSYDCPEVWTLRRFRDNVLAKTTAGRLFIKTYYACSPTIVRWFGSFRLFNRIFKPMLDSLVKHLNQEGIKDTFYVD